MFSPLRSNSADRLRILLTNAGIANNSAVLIHTGWRVLRGNYPGLEPRDLFDILTDIIGSGGSLLVPAFTYNFKKKYEPQEAYVKECTPSKVGFISESFRSFDEFQRTSSSTHSFLIWGKVTGEIDALNEPDSPLGIDSPLQWFISTEASSVVLMLGADFESFTLGHAFERFAKVPWEDHFSWDNADILPIGVSKKDSSGEVQEKFLRQVPGCSKGFVQIGKFLIQEKFAQPLLGSDQSTIGYSVDVKAGIHPTVEWMRSHYLNLLCAPRGCVSCDSRKELIGKGIRVPYSE